jgi:adenylyl cyclase-associated protein
MQTHKNSKLRDGTIPMVAPKPKPALTGSVSVGFSGQFSSIRSPRFELEGKKWMIENHRNNQNLSIKNPDMSQSVYVFQCEGSTIKIDGKVNNIVVDSCKKTSVIFNDVIAACEFINCQSVEMQVTFLVPISFFFYLIIHLFNVCISKFFRFSEKLLQFLLRKLTAAKCT